MATRVKEPTQIGVAVGLPAPIGRLKPKLAKDLERLCREKVTLPAQSIGVDVPFYALTKVPQGPMWGKTPRGTWFYGTDFTEDPATDWRGRIPVQDEERSQLDALRKAGVQFDSIFVVHEVPADWEPGTPLPELVPKPPAFRRADAILTEASIALGAAMSELANALSSTLSELSKPRPVTTTVGSYDDSSWGDYDPDPVILGGIALPDGSGVAWFKLAQWEWR